MHRSTPRIAAVLSELPADHPTRLAYGDHKDAIRLTHLVGCRNLSERLTQVFLDGYNEVLGRQAQFRP